MRTFFLVLILLHGIIHLLGFIKAFRIAELNQLTQSISKPVGIFWLIAALLFIMAAVLYYFNVESWWIISGVAIIISQIIIILSWKDAMFGTVANIILLAVVAIAFAGSLPSNYKNIFKLEVEKSLKRSAIQTVLNEEEIKHLPLPIQKYIIYSGAVGKEKVQNLKMEFKGGIKPKPDSDFLDFCSIQYNFFDEPARLFYIESKMYGLPFDGFHRFVGPKATMQIKIASLFQVVDAKGPEMDKGETVTMFNDMCFFAPGNLIDKNIEWETVDTLTVKAKFTNKGITISALLFFNKRGELINFSSDDRYESADGQVYKNYKWTTPAKNYKEINGRRIAGYAEAIWHKPEGEFCYGKFNLVNIQYNCRYAE